MLDGAGHAYANAYHSYARAGHGYEDTEASDGEHMID